MMPSYASAPPTVPLSSSPASSAFPSTGAHSTPGSRLRPAAADKRPSRGGGRVNAGRGFMDDEGIDNLAVDMDEEIGVDDEDNEGVEGLGDHDHDVDEDLGVDGDDHDDEVDEE